MINLPEFDLYIFDLDDTLVNTRQAYHSAQETAVSHVFPELKGENLKQRLSDLAWLCRIFGSGQPDNYFSAFAAAISGSNKPEKSRVADLVTIYHAEFRNNLRPFDGAIDYLKQLSNLRKKLALVSNGKVAAQLQKLERTGLTPFFPDPCRFISETVLPTQKKPSPYMLEQACKNAGTPPDHAVFFGNIPADILAGNLAGTATVLFGTCSETGSETPVIARPDHWLKGWTT